MYFSEMMNGSIEEFKKLWQSFHRIK
ncbi:uncharacterized protein METZ01_LOCUS50976 [marine metagenome]|uniref:Uncharacterized protein n=1 Tax=marine metagenome TaxID=408172 RepID=A0A381S213_9ZZZZ